MVNAARLASAKRITAVVPWFPYARQDKKSAPREPITARLVADMLETAGVDRVLTMDLHAGQVQGFFRVPVDHMTALPMFQQYFLDLGLPREDIVVISPDTGRVKLAKKFAEMLGGELAVLTKERPAHSRPQVTNVIGDVAGKICVISDDMIDTAGTLVAGAAGDPRGGRARASTPAPRTRSSRSPRCSGSRTRCSSKSWSAIRFRSIRRPSPTRCGFSRSRGSSPRPSTTSSPTTRCRRSSRARTSFSRCGASRPRTTREGSHARDRDT